MRKLKQSSSIEAIFSSGRECILGLLLCLWLSACAAGSRPIIYQTDFLGRISQKSLEMLLWENNLGPDDKISSVPLLKSDLASYHLVQVKDKESFHKHEYHDLAIFMQSGTGIVNFEKESTKVGAGSVFFIPHGAAHQFINTGPAPAVAIIVFSPPYDDKDTVPVKTREE